MDATKPKRNAAGGNKRGLIIGIGILLCLGIVVISLYPTLQDYYIAYRYNEKLLYELSAVEERNAGIREQIEYLNTDEGIADRARERFGWTQEGEQAVNITGLDVSDSTTVLPETVVAGSISAPENWWTRFLDALFAVEEEKPAERIPDPFISEDATSEADAAQVE